MIDSVALVAGVQQSNSYVIVMHIHVPVLFQILLLVKLLQNTE